MMTSQGNSGRVCVIVVTFNSRRYFERLRATLEAQSVPFVLYVVDNASRPEERPRQTDFPAATEILQMDNNRGFAAANNYAAALFDGEYVALLNPDAFPEPNWLAALLAAAQRWPDAVAFGSTQISSENETRFDGLGDCYSIAGIPWRGGFGWSRATTVAEEGEVFSPCAAAALYRYSTWRNLNGFDESFFCYCEDVDFGFRARLAGGSCMQIPSAVVRHVGGGSSGRRSQFAAFYGARNRIWTYLKNMPTPLLAISLPAHVLITLCIVAISPLRGVGPATCAGVLAGLKGAMDVWRQRRRIQASRKVSLLQIAQSFSWRPDSLILRAPVIRAASTRNR